MINNLDCKSKKELLEIVQIQMDEYQKLQQVNDEAQSLIGLLEIVVSYYKKECGSLQIKCGKLLEAEIKTAKLDVIDSVNDLYGMMASTMKPMSMSECLDQIEQELNK